MINQKKKKPYTFPNLSKIIAPQKKTATLLPFLQRVKEWLTTQAQRWIFVQQALVHEVAK